MARTGARSGGHSRPAAWVSTLPSISTLRRFLLAAEALNSPEVGLVGRSRILQYLEFYFPVCAEALVVLPEMYS